MLVLLLQVIYRFNPQMDDLDTHSNILIKMYSTLDSEDQVMVSAVCAYMHKLQLYILPYLSGVVGVKDQITIFCMFYIKSNRINSTEDPWGTKKRVVLSCHSL